MLKIKDKVTNLTYIQQQFARIVVELLGNFDKQNMNVYISVNKDYEIINSKLSESIVTKKVNKFKNDLKLFTKPVCSLVIPFIIDDKINIIYLVCLEKTENNAFFNSTSQDYFLNKYKFKLESNKEKLELKLRHWIKYSFYYTNSFSSINEGENLVGTKIWFHQMSKLDEEACCELMDFATCNQELNIFYPNIKRENKRFLLTFIFSSIIVSAFILGYFLGVNCTPPKIISYNKISLNGVQFDYRKSLDLSLISKQIDYFLVKDRIKSSVIICGFNDELLMSIGRNRYKTYWNHPQVALYCIESKNNILPMCSLSHKIKYLIQPIYLGETDLYGLENQQYMDSSVTFSTTDDVEILKYTRIDSLKFIKRYEPIIVDRFEENLINIQKGIKELNYKYTSKTVKRLIL